MRACARIEENGFATHEYPLNRESGYPRLVSRFAASGTRAALPFESHQDDDDVSTPLHGPWGASSPGSGHIEPHRASIRRC